VIVCLALGRFVVRLLLGERSERYMMFVRFLIGVTLLAVFSTLLTSALSSTRWRRFSD